MMMRQALQNRKRFVTAVSAVAFFILSLLPLSVFAQVDERFELPVGNSLQTGPADAPVTLIEFLDFQ